MTDEAEQPPQSPAIEQKPPRLKPRIKAAPQHGQLYWCDFWRDAQLPEIWKTRPIMVLSYKNTLHGTCLVIPTSTDPDQDPAWSWELSVSLDGRRNWAICNQLHTVAVSRLSNNAGKIIRVPKTEFNEILRRVTAWLPRPFDLTGLGAPPT